MKSADYFGGMIVGVVFGILLSTIIMLSVSAYRAPVDDAEMATKAYEFAEFCKGYAQRKGGSP